MIRPASPADLPIIHDSWLRSYSSSEWALLLTPRDRDHVQEGRCSRCEKPNGHATLRSHRVRGVTVYHAGETYWQRQKAIIASLVAHCNVAVYVENEPMVDGWIVRDWTRPIVDYVWVRKSARMSGVARRLLAELADAPEVQASHLSTGVDRKRLPRGWTFDKALAFRWGAAA